MILEQCKRVRCVDLGESFQTHIYLQNLASIQPRTNPVKFARSRTGALRVQIAQACWVVCHWMPCTPSKIRKDLQHLPSVGKAAPHAVAQQFVPGAVVAGDEAAAETPTKPAGEDAPVRGGRPVSGRAELRALKEGLPTVAKCRLRRNWYRSGMVRNAA